ncbi:MAG: cupin domain-containing protein [Methylophilaceae bacterium]|nr:cupin domain-containing protein [Methylophilaceae bacterium]
MQNTLSPIHINQLQSRQLLAKATGEPLSLVKSLSAAFALKNVQIHHETLLVGTKASSAHFHTQKEELIFVLTGNPSARINGEVLRLKPGDALGFAAGIGFAHYVFNDMDKPASYLSVGTNAEADEVIYV